MHSAGGQMRGGIVNIARILRSSARHEWEQKKKREREKATGKKIRHWRYADNVYVMEGKLGRGVGQYLKICRPS